MKLVVEIPEEQYITLNAKSQEEVVSVLDYTLLVNAIKNGMPCDGASYEEEDRNDN